MTVNQLDIFGGETPIEAVVVFDDFWSKYPRKQGKQGALKAWKKMTAPEKLAAVAAAVNWAAYCDARGTVEYAPHGSTWLNQRRWEEPTPPLPTRERTTMKGRAGIEAALANTNRKELPR